MSAALFSDAAALARTALVGVLAYATLILLLRASGKRTLSKMNAFDLVVTVALGSTLATILLDKTVALAQGALAILVLVGLQFAITWSSVRAAWVRRLVTGEPALLARDGRCLPHALRRERVTEEEVRAAVRGAGMSARLTLLAASLAAAACTGPPRERDFFLPPYAEKGCWARFYEQADFGEPMRQIEGPIFVEAIPGGLVEVPNMHEAGVQPLFVEARSLVVGPHARLIGYSQPLFRGEAIPLGPGTRVPDATALGYPQRFASLKLECKA